MAESNEADGAPPDILSLLAKWGNNFTTQTHNTFSNLRPHDYIRLVVIIGGYCLLRPYLMKLGAHMQMKAHKRDEEAEKQETANNDFNGATLDANDLRGAKIALPGVDSDDESDGEVREGDWGKRARLRQRAFVRETLVEAERRLMEKKDEAEDKDIEEFLVEE
ncbi:DUF1531-domain-containing protein [Saccharata proteae CBS 121410]|uniref:DUF1531-domain-containing protein n=1 Tax=Saccharata proteae CBS 121410 TaxID=1314787 RepID=A0A9P4HZ56_9PEZI|nr:DUF1531-domain-containing protein [Saccharata proteae CBS 121410]